MEKKNVLIVVDYQKDFVDGALGFESAKNLDKGISELINKYAKDKNGLIICTFDTHNEKYLDTQEGRKLPVEHCKQYTDGWELYGKTGDTVNNLIGDVMHNDMEYGCNSVDRRTDKVIFVYKPTFPSLSLGTLLSYMDNEADGGVESITLVGVVTNMCVISNAVMAKAVCPEAEIIIKKDLVDSFDKELHQKALDVMASMQMTVE